MKSRKPSRPSSRAGVTNVVIRAAAQSDVPAIQRLYRQLDRHHVELLPEVFRPLRGHARKEEVITGWMARSDAKYFVATLGRRVVGFLNVERVDRRLKVFRPRTVAAIENAVVDAGHRGRGIGGRLFDAAAAWARAEGAEQLQVSVWHANAGAMEFYRDRGFRPVTSKLEMSIT